MREKLRIWKWKICIWILGMMLVWQVENLISNLVSVEDTAGEHFVATDVSRPRENQLTTEMHQQPTPVPTPFTLTNFDKIRVVITNKEIGGVYHEDVTYFREGAGYRGTLEILETEAGYVVINELPIEEYLYSVVPSEMPASYPMEALKAQAICARTYAYLHILSPGYPQWNAHVDDTTAFQVYHSVEEQERTNQAVNETQGMVLLAPGGQSLAQTYYYSTSCGFGSDAHVWRTKYSDSYPYIMSRHINRDAAEAMATAVVTSEVYGGNEKQQDGMTEDAAMILESNVVNAGSVGVLQGGVTGHGQNTLDEAAFTTYIKTVNSTDYEAQESWYRWNYDVEEVDLERMLKNLQKRYAANNELVLTLQGGSYVSRPIEELDVLVDLVIEKREAGGVADELLIITEKNVYKVITELNIRYVLNDGVTKVLRQDGSAVAMPTLLPSAFIVLENQYNNGEVTGYYITGGGYGHGAGMSQNAAKAMAEEGMSAEEILTFFFADCTLENK